MKKLDLEFSESIAKNNDVSIKDLLDAINIFHEVIAEEYPECPQDHPHIELFADGGGCVVSSRYKWYKNCDGILFRFHSLKDLVKKYKSLVKKYKVKYVKYGKIVKIEK